MLDVAAFDRAVAEAGALDAAADALVSGALVDVFDRVERLANAADAFAHHLAGSELVARIEDVPFADVPAVHADLLGQHVHDAFHRELRLVAAEAAHRAGVRVVGVDRLGVDVDVRDAVDAARVARRAQGALGARRVIAAGIRDDAGPQRQQMSVRIGADGQLDRHRMTLDVMLRRLLASEHGLHRTTEQHRRHRRLSLDRQLLFRAERAAARQQRDLDVLRIELQDLRDLLVVVDRSLAVRDHLDAVALRQHEARFGLEECDLDRLRVERRFDHVRGRLSVPRRRRRVRTRSSAAGCSTDAGRRYPTDARAARPASAPRMDR